MDSCYYCPQTRFAKVMLRRCFSTGEVSVHGGLCPGGSLSQGVSVQRGLCRGESLSRGSLSGGSLSRGLCLRGVSVQGHLCLRGLCPGGGSVRETPSVRLRAGGTHPTGMHSYYPYFSVGFSTFYDCGAGRAGNRVISEVHYLR